MSETLSGSLALAAVVVKWTALLLLLAVTVPALATRLPMLFGCPTCAAAEASKRLRRRPNLPRLYRCDHCGERVAWDWCTACGVALCAECKPNHQSHAECGNA